MSQFSNHDQIRCLISIVGSTFISSSDKAVCRGYRNHNFSYYGRNTGSGIVSQKRAFLGCGDGGEGNMLSKVYEERRVLGYSPEQLFNVVGAVDIYEEFLPWCQRSEIVCRFPDGSFDAELEIGFKFLVESYISHVEVNKPKSIKIANMFFNEVVSRLANSFSD